MISACKKANQLSDAYKKAMAYCKEVFPFFEEIRYHCDKLELIVDASLWPMAKYRQLLFMQQLKSLLLGMATLAMKLYFCIKVVL